MCCGRVGKKRDAKKTTEGWAGWVVSYNEIVVKFINNILLFKISIIFAASH
jgi:hypothetical protein